MGSRPPTSQVEVKEDIASTGKRLPSRRAHWHAKTEASCPKVEYMGTPAPQRRKVRYFVDAVVIPRRKHKFVKVGSVELKLLNHRKKTSIIKDRVAQSKARAKEETNTKQSPMLSVQLEVSDSQVAGTRSPPVMIREESPNPILPNAAPGPATQKKDDEKPMELWKNPKMKVKKEGMSFPSDTIRARLDSANISPRPLAIDCSKDILDETVSRAFMSNVYGGSPQSTFPSIGKKKLVEHGLDDFMYLNTSYQPIAPEVPGSPGIWITTAGDECWEWDEGIVRVFTKITKTPAEWSYQGQYELKRAEPLTREEWTSLKPSVRNTWARELCKQDWGVDMRIRIYQRMQFGRSPTEAEYEHIEEQKLYESVVWTDVARFLHCGDERLSLVTMKCVGYDIPFQKQLVDRWRAWTPPEKGSTKRKTKSRAQTKVDNKRPTKRQKLEAKVIIVDELDSEDEDDGFAEDSEEEYGSSEEGLDGEVKPREPAYVPRGTRSRPRM